MHEHVEGDFKVHCLTFPIELANLRSASQCRPQFDVRHNDSGPIDSLQTKRRSLK